LTDNDTDHSSEPQPFVWFDERVIEAEHDRVVEEKQELKDHLKVIHNCFDLLHVILRNHPYQESNETLALLRLVARVFNSAGACLKLARAGYFQPAFAMVRDILEIEFLSDMFRRDRKHLKQWMTLDAKTRNKEFRQVKIREYLDEKDGFKERKRAEAYALLSEHAAHASPIGFHVISPDGMTQIGPFPSEDRLLALFQELTKHLQMTCIHLASLLEPKDAIILKSAKDFQDSLVVWRTRYMGDIQSGP
jgi:hypothetical protein